MSTLTESEVDAFEFTKWQKVSSDERDRTRGRPQREVELRVIGNGRSHGIHKNTDRFLKENNIHKNNNMSVFVLQLCLL